MEMGSSLSLLWLRSRDRSSGSSSMRHLFVGKRFVAHDDAVAHTQTVAWALDFATTEGTELSRVL